MKGKKASKVKAEKIEKASVALEAAEMASAAEAPMEAEAPVAITAPSEVKEPVQEAVTVAEPPEKKVKVAGAKKQAKKPVAKKVSKTEAKAAEAPKKKGGRPKMSDDEKAAAQAARQEAKEKAANMVPELYLQFAGGEFDISALVETAKADFKAQKKRTPLTELRIYFKPEDGAAYYVANGGTAGKIEIK